MPPEETNENECVALLLDDGQPAIDKLNWLLHEGYRVVDRFDLQGSFIVILRKP